MTEHELARFLQAENWDATFRPPSPKTCEHMLALLVQVGSKAAVVFSSLGDGDLRIEVPCTGDRSLRLVITDDGGYLYYRAGENYGTLPLTAANLTKVIADEPDLLRARHTCL